MSDRSDRKSRRASYINARYSGTNISIKNLEYFVSIAETKNYATSAEELFTSKSALSRGITSLENELGCALLHRSARGVVLTQDGEHLLMFANNIVTECKRMMRYISHYKEAPTGIVKFGLNDSISTNLLFLRMALGILEHEYPDIEFIVSHHNTDELKHLYDTGQVDVIIISRFVAERLTDARIKTAYTDCMSVVLNENHRLASRKTIKFSELEGERMLTCSKEANADFFKYMVRLCSRNHMIPEFTICDFREIKLRASLGQGVGMMPFYDPNLNYSMPELVMVPLDLDTDDFDRVIVRKVYNRNRCSDILFDIIDDRTEDNGDYPDETENE